MLQSYIYKGHSIEPYISDFSNLRLKTFYEYPYLYRGNIEDEEKYLKTFCQNPNSLLCVIKNKDKSNCLAYLSGMPLVSYPEVCNQVETMFQQKEYHINEFFYFSEFIVKPEFRGNNFATQMHNTILKTVEDMGYNYNCLATVYRDEFDGRKPIDYHTESSLWKKLGYRLSDIHFYYTWPTYLDENKTKDIMNKMLMWIKV